MVESKFKGHIAVLDYLVDTTLNQLNKITSSASLTVSELEEILAISKVLFLNTKHINEIIIALLNKK